MTYESKYQLGDVVYLKTCPEQVERMITGVKFIPGSVLYSLSFMTIETEHYEIEIVADKDVLKMITN